MAKIAIVYHSGYGHTKKVADLVAEGAKSSGAEVSVYDAETAIVKIDELDNADAIIFGSPTYMGGVSAKFKEFCDATSKKWFTQAWKNKIAAGFTNSGSLSGDKQGTLQYLVTFAMQHGMVWVGQGEPPASSTEHGGKPEQINRMGSQTGLMTQSDNAAPEITPSKGDIETAKLFGKRVAETTVKWSGK
ncbi:MAG TPA: NADPH-dependent FMN reductase [Alphaproteobacteria bacterium]|nr:NADPH-dependent FMN reductase [Alphaproteobacteria bacterium]